MDRDRLLLKILIFIILVSLIYPLFSREMVSVLDFRAEGEVSEHEANTLRDLFETELIGSGQYTVIEKAQQDEVISAQKDSLQGCVDDACAVEIGKLLSADRILLGSVAKIGSMYILQVKLIDIETSRSEKAESINADSIEGLVEKISILVGLITGKGESGGKGEIIYEDDPESPPSNEGRGYVVIKSEPTGALFTLKNMEGEVLRSGMTPQSLTLGFATYIIEARDSEGLYIPFSENLEVNRSGRMTYNIELLPDFGSIMVASTPPGMQVLSGGMSIGTTPYRNERFKSGGYDLIVKDPEGLYLSDSISFQMEPGENISRSVRLEPNFVEISLLENRGVSGRVYIDGDYRGRLPYAGKIPFSDADIRIVPDDSRYYTYEESIRPRRAGETVSRSFSFSGKRGYLIVESEPFAEGDLYIDGEKAGTFPDICE